METSKEKVVVLKCGCGLTGINPLSFLINSEISKKMEEKLAKMVSLKLSGKIGVKCRDCGEEARWEAVWRDVFDGARERYFLSNPDMREKVERLSQLALEKQEGIFAYFKTMYGRKKQ